MWPKALKSPDPDHMGHLEGKNKCPWNVIKTQKTLRLRLSLHPSAGGGPPKKTHLRGMAMGAFAPLWMGYLHPTLPQS